MKTKISLFFGTLSCLSIGLNAATIAFTNHNSNFSSYAPIVDSNGSTVLFGSGSVSVGYFTNEGAVSGGDFSSFVLFGSPSTINGSGFEFDGVFNSSTTQTIPQSGPGSEFVGQNIFTFISFDSEFLVAKSDTTFEFDNPDFIAELDIFNDPDISYLFGGAAGPTVDIGGGPVGSISLQAVPEPSSFALIAGCFGLALAVVRRRSRCA